MKPQDENKTEMVNSPSTTKMDGAEGNEKGPAKTEAKDPHKGKIQIEAVQPCNIRVEGKKHRMKPGERAYVTPEEAKSLCKPLKGFYAFSGERYHADGEALKQHVHVRAKLVGKQASA